MYYTKPKRKPKQPAHSGKLRIIPLGGLEEVGRNMTVIEYGNHILIIDMGLQFPEEDMPGIDYIIPNIAYLKGKEKNIRGVIITHGHYDHIGAIPHLIPMLGNPPIFSSDISLAIIKKRQEDYKNVTPLNLKTVNHNTVLRLGVFRVEFFKVSHNIPASMGVIIYTPVGIIVHTGDFKLDLHTQDRAIKPDIEKLRNLSRQGVLAMLADSTNASQPGHQLTETQIKRDLETIIANSPGRMIIATFSSLLERLQQIIELSEKYNKKVVIEGYSMKTNVEIAKRLGYMKFKKTTVISTRQMRDYPSNRIVILCTGAQGEENAVLMRIANREHRTLKVEKGDTVVFSSSVVPGNERAVQRLTDSLYREGADVINYTMVDIHAGGHAKQEDLKFAIRLVRPKYLIPIEGHHSFLRMHAKMAESIGFPKKNIFIADNGQIIEFTKHQATLTNKKVPSSYVMVDGLGVGDVGNVVLRDRQMLAADGMFVIIATIEAKTGNLVGNPDIISRGFIYMKDNRELLDKVREKVKKILIDREPKASANDAYIKNKVRDVIGQFLFSKTKRRPMVLPVVIEV